MSITLVSVGLTLFIYTQDYFPGEQPQPGTILGMLLGATFTGIGIAYPFKRRVVIGSIVGGMLLIAAVLMFSI